MRISDPLAARVRTVWPMLLGYLAARLLVLGAPVADWLRDALGVEVTQPQVAAALGIILGWIIYEAGRWLEKRAGDSGPARLARKLAQLLLSLGLVTGQPVYARQGENVRVLTADGRMRRPS